VHASPSSQAVGHVLAGSQVSLSATTPSPQLAEQSLSVSALQPWGQHPSPASQAVLMALTHTTSQVSGAPLRLSSVHALASSQLLGQVLAGSQLSPVSSTPLPQLGGRVAVALLPSSTSVPPAAPELLFASSLLGAPDVLPTPNVPLVSALAVGATWIP
jgi:hypothetical protein